MPRSARMSAVVVTLTPATGAASIRQWLVPLHRRSRPRSIPGTAGQDGGASAPPPARPRASSGWTPHPAPTRNTTYCARRQCPLPNRSCPEIQTPAAAAQARPWRPRHPHHPADDHPGGPEHEGPPVSTGAHHLRTRRGGSLGAMISCRFEAVSRSTLRSTALAGGLVGIEPEGTTAADTRTSCFYMTARMAPPSTGRAAPVMNDALFEHR